MLQVRQHGVQGGDGFRRQFGQTAVLFDQVVGRQHAEAAAIGDDRQPFAGDTLIARQDFNRVEQLLQGGYPHHAGAPERGVRHRVGAGQRAGMRGGRALTLGEAAGLHHHDRLGPTGLAAGRHELARLCHAFHVEQDRRASVIARQVVEQVADVDVRHVADRHQMREADAARCRPVDDAGQHRARLADESDPPGGNAAAHETGVQSRARHHHAKTVGSDDAQEMRPGGLQHGGLQLSSLGIVAFGEPGADHHDAARTAVAQLPDQPRDRRGRRANDGEVRRLRQAVDIGVAGLVQQPGKAGIDEVERAGEATVLEVPCDNGADVARPVAGADQRHASRPQNGAQVVHRHVARPPVRSGIPVRGDTAMIERKRAQSSSARAMMLRWISAVPSPIT